MYRRLVVAAAVVAAAAATMLVPSAPATASAARSPGPGYVTLLFGRTQWVQTEDCRPVEGAVPLSRVAEDLRDRGLTATGTVVLDRTEESTRLCFGGYTLHPSWDDLADLRDSYGWSFVSAGRSYGNMLEMTAWEQRVASCGTLAAFAAHGHYRAWGMFAYPNNSRSEEIQEQIVSTCFAWGRAYASRPTPSTQTDPFWQYTLSVNGGRCHDPELACATLSVPNEREYTDPAVLTQMLHPGPDEWSAVQFYRLVEGASDGGATQWDCTAADWRQHWTSKPETYCKVDYDAAIASIPDSVVVTDPATVARAWGRGNPASLPLGS